MISVASYDNQFVNMDSVTLEVLISSSDSLNPSTPLSVTGKGILTIVSVRAATTEEVQFEVFINGGLSAGVFRVGANNDSVRPLLIPFDTDMEIKAYRISGTTAYLNISYLS